MTTSSRNATTNSQVLDSMHMDYVHHVSFDMYGRRMATCSGDGRVRIWDLDADGTWKLAPSWQAHKSSISQCQWAHPEFGALLATCGSDHDVKIWEEPQDSSLSSLKSNSNNNNNNRWMEKAKLTEARRAVTCLEFAPRQLGLMIATGSSDGSVRIYEAVDLMNLAQWPIQATIVLGNLYNGDHSLLLAETNHHTKNESIMSLGVTCLSWGTGRFEPPTLVVGGGGSLQVYRYTNKTWQSLLVLPPPPNHPSGGGHVLDVAWAPNVGRRHHWVAAVYPKEMVVYKLSRANNTLKLESTQTLLLQEQGSNSNSNNMFTCQWNVTGTVLASSGDGGVVQLWKSDFEGNFKCVSQIYGNVNNLDHVDDHHEAAVAMLT